MCSVVGPAAGEGADTVGARPNGWSIRRFHGGRVRGGSDEGSLLLLRKGQPALGTVVVDDDEISETDLSGGEQVGERKNEMPLDRALQVSRPILFVDPFLEQEIAGGVCALDHKLAAHARRDDPLLDVRQ